MLRLMQLRFAAAASPSAAAVSLTAASAFAFTQADCSARRQRQLYVYRAEQRQTTRFATKAPVHSAPMARQFSSAFNRGWLHRSVARRATVTMVRLRIRIFDHLAPATSILA